MKSLLLAIFVGLAVARVDEDSYKSNRQYTYRYEAQLVTGSPQSSKLWSGLRLSAKLDLYFLTKKRVTAVLTEVSLQKMDKFVEDRTPSFFMQDEDRLMDGVEADVNAVMIRQLQVPFQFMWNAGRIEQVFLEQDEPEWSGNIKRGAAGLFQVNLDQLYSLDPIANKGDIVNPIMPAYTVWEGTTFGYCLTTYTPTPDPTGKGFYLTKVRDYSSCLKKANMAYVFNNIRSEDNSSSPKHLDLQGEVTYALTGTKSRFLVLSAVGESKVVFTPWAYSDGNVQTSINQTAYLLNAKTERSPPAFPRQAGTTYRQTALEMEMPIKSIENMQPYSLYEPKPEDQPRQQSIWGQKKLEQLLTWVANGTHTYPSQDVLMTMQTLMELLRQTQPYVLKDLLRELLANRNRPGHFLGELKFKIYWDLLASAGTTGASNALLDQCLLDDGSLYQQCVSAITGVGIYSPPSAMIIGKLTNLAKKWRLAEREVQGGSGQRQMKDIVMVAALALGSVVGRAEETVKEMDRQTQRDLQGFNTIMNQDTAFDKLPELKQSKEYLEGRLHSIHNQHNQIVNKFVEDVTEMFLKSDLDFESIVGLKALRNAHVAASVPTLRRHLLAKTRDPAVRITAAQAFDKFALHQNKHDEVLEVLELVLKTPEDVAALRVQCFRSMINVQAPVARLVRLAHSLRNEKERQLTTYVRSVFEKLATESDFLPYRQAQAECQQALGFLPQQGQTAMQDSSYRSWYQQIMGKDSSLLNEVSYINTPRSVAVADATTYLSLFGTNNKAVQFSWVSDGLEKLVKKMLGPKGFFTDRNSLFDLLARTRRSANTKDLINDIVRKLSIKARDLPKVKGFLNVQLLNNDVRAFELSTFMQNLVNLDMVETKFAEQEWKRGVSVNYSCSGILGQFYMELPSEAGFPLSMQLGLAYSANILATVYGGVDTSVYKETRNGMPPARVEAGLYVDPKVAVSVMGKMAVDGYIFQSGSMFTGSLHYQTPFSINGSLHLHNSHLNIKFSPPVNADMPILKLDMKPYVFSRAVPNNVTAAQPAVNRRPIFYTMQPVVIGNGAKSQMTNLTLYRDFLGYDVKVQGEHAWRALPLASATPLLGVASYAVYVKPALLQPPFLQADLRYFSKPRYMVSASQNGPAQPACDGWFSLFCYGTDEESDAEALNTNNKNNKNNKNNNNYNNNNKNADYAPAYPAFPDLSQPITFDSIKQKIERRMGEAMPWLQSTSQWAMIVTVNSSAAGLERGLTLEALMQAWKEGQFHESYFLLSRTALPGYDNQPFNLNMKTSTLFPSQKNAVKDLMDSDYQMDAQSDMLRLMKTRQHKVINKYLQKLMMTKTSQDAMRHQPSMEPKMLLDAIMPEMIMQAHDGLSWKVRGILRRLLPLTEQLEELRSEMKDTFKLMDSQALVLELSHKVYKLQTALMQVLRQMDGAWHPEAVISSVEYCLLKESQATFAVRSLLHRGAKVWPLREMKSMAEALRLSIEEQQLNIYTLAAIKLAAARPVSPRDINTNTDDNNQHQDDVNQSPYAYHPEAIEDPAAEAGPQVPAPQSVDALIASLHKLQRQQLKDLPSLWQQATAAKPAAQWSIESLMMNAAGNVSMVNAQIQQRQFRNRNVTELLLQAAIKQQIFVELLHALSDNVTNSLPTSNQDQELNRAHRYAFKVQTKQLLERACVLQQQQKESLVCGAQLTSPLQQHALAALQQLDRRLLAIQQRNIRVPSSLTPWTADVTALRTAALTTLTAVLRDCRGVRDALLQEPAAQPPCLAQKLVHTALSLQRMVHIFHNTLPAQTFQAQLSEQYEALASQTMSFLVNLKPLFHKYVTLLRPDAPSVFPLGNVLISQGMLEVSMIRHQQTRVQSQLSKFLFKTPEPAFDVIKRILQNSAALCKDLKEKLVAEAPRVQNSMQTTSELTAYSLWAQYYQSLEQQISIYDSLQQQLDLHSQHPDLPAIKQQIQHDKLKIGQLMHEMSRDTDRRSDSSDNDMDDDMPTIPSNSAADDYSFGWAQEDQPMRPSRLPVNGNDAMRTSLTSAEVDNMESKFSAPTPRNQVVFLANITYTGDKHVGIQIVARKSVQQLLWETAQFYPLTRDACVAKAIRQTMAAREELEACSKEVHNRLNSYLEVHLNIATNYNELPPLMQRYSQTMLRKAQHVYHDSAVVSAPQPWIAEGSMQAVFDFSPRVHSADQYYMTREETLEIESAPLPASRVLQALFPFQNVAPLPRHALARASQGRRPATCKVDRNNVMTTDGAVFRVPRLAAPQTDTAQCRTLLAMDCSSDHTFAMLLKQAHISSAQILEIIAEEHEVKLIPDFISDRVIVDGKEEVVTPGHPIVKYKKIAYGKEAVAMVISRKPSGYLHVEYPLAGLDIVFDLYYINVEMSTVYQNQLCGLCGNFDGQITGELEGPQRNLYTAADPFFLSYVLRGDQCTVEAPHPLYKEHGQPIAIAAATHRQRNINNNNNNNNYNNNNNQKNINNDYNSPLHDMVYDM